MHKATARAHANIAFIKYWGNRDNALRLPTNGSISMNLDSLYTDTTVIWDDHLPEDTLAINGKTASDAALSRVSKHLDHLREFLGISAKATVTSENNFPMGAGIASSAAAFAALTVAAVNAYGQDTSERVMSTLARLGSGSASRSVPAGFVEWFPGTYHEESYAETIAQPDHWNLVDVIAIVSTQHKHTTSQAGHPTADTSDLQDARVSGAEERLQLCRDAIQQRNFEALAAVVEHDSNLMHAVMMTSRPPLFYWEPATLTIMNSVRMWRHEGIDVCYTLDAGPNVHCICTKAVAETVRNRLSSLSGIVDIRTACVGGAAHILDAPDS